MKTWIIHSGNQEPRELQVLPPMALRLYCRQGIYKLFFMDEMKERTEDLISIGVYTETSKANVYFLGKIAEMFLLRNEISSRHEMPGRFNALKVMDGKSRINLFNNIYKKMAADFHAEIKQFQVCKKESIIKGDCFEVARYCHYLKNKAMNAFFDVKEVNLSKNNELEVTVSMERL